LNARPRIDKHKQRFAMFYPFYSSNQYLWLVITLLGTYITKTIALEFFKQFAH